MTGTDVLVVYASRSGGTEEIASAIAQELRARRLRVHVREARGVHDLVRYRAVVLGSALYFGRWRPSAVRFLRRHRDELARMRVWLFQSGPLDRTSQVRTPRAVRRLLPFLGADPPVTFGGRLDAGTARGFLARDLVAQRKGGDFRDWAAIRAWAHAIAEDLAAASPEERGSTTLGHPPT